MRSVVHGFLDLLYPPACPACDADTEGRVALCGTCEISLYPLGTACPRCAEPIEGPLAIQCRRCTRTPPPFEAAAAPYRYGGQLAVALQRLKYQRRPDIARTLAPLLAPALAEASRDVDVVIPIPLHWLRRSKRGFNQARLLLDEARWGSEPAIDALSLRRTRATPPQAGMNAADRARNVDGAFDVPPRRHRHVAGKRVLLFDDVMTTGATAAAAARALLEAGAASVRCLSLARAEN